MFSRCESRRIKFQILVKFSLKFGKIHPPSSIFSCIKIRILGLQHAKAAQFVLINAARIDICVKFCDIRLRGRRMTVDVKNAFVLAKIASTAKYVA